MNDNKYLRAEWGSSQPVNFLNPSQVKMYDSDNNEIVIPKCEKCQCFKGQVIGKESFMWICHSCGSQ